MLSKASILRQVEPAPVGGPLLELVWSTSGDARPTQRARAPTGRQLGCALFCRQPGIWASWIPRRDRSSTVSGSSSVRVRSLSTTGSQHNSHLLFRHACTTLNSQRAGCERCLQAAASQAVQVLRPTLCHRKSAGSSPRAQTHSNASLGRTPAAPCILPPWANTRSCMSTSCCAARTQASRLQRCAVCSSGSVSTSASGADHHIFAKSHVEEILNLQPKGGRAKPYQVRQIREALLKYNLRLED